MMIVATAWLICFAGVLEMLDRAMKRAESEEL